jgi:hypothetical protein
VSEPIDGYVTLRVPPAKKYDPENAEPIRTLTFRRGEKPKVEDIGKDGNLPGPWATPTPATPHAPDETPVAPERDTDDDATLYAWYGPYGWCENYRKVTLAQCREIVRAQYALKNEKVTESRLDDLARTHALYLDFLATHLKGRQQYEHAYLKARGAA